MKKLLSFLILISFTFSSYSAPCYGTRLPQKGKIYFGYQTYAIFKRYLEKDYGKLRSIQHFFLLSWGVFDWLSIDLKGGCGNIKQHPQNSDEIDYPTSFAGGYGFRVKFYQRKKIKAVFGFQHISVHPKKVFLEKEKNKAVLDDWQFSLLTSVSFKKITPYLGVRWSRTDYIHWQANKRKRKKSDLTKQIGLIFGFDLPLNDKIWFNIEGQFTDTEALAFSINFSL
jgi:nitrate reductase NapE component